MNILPKTYETLLLLEQQRFEVAGRDYIITDQYRECNGKEQEISYRFSPYPNKNSTFHVMSHERVDELERDNKIKYK